MATDLAPLAGNPTMLRVMANEHLETAESIRDAASSLRALASRIRTRSQAVDVVRDVADDVSDLIIEAEIRYSGTADALRTYSFALESAHSRANSAINASANNQGELNTARYYMAEAEERAQRDTPERVQAIEDYGRWKQRVRDLEGQIGAAEGEYAAAVTDLNDAAQVAISAINAAIEKSGLNDSILDRMREAWDALVEYFEKYIAPYLSVIQEILKVLAEIAGWVAFFLAVFFPLLAPLAGALLIVALVLHGLSLMLTIVLALRGERSLGDVIVGVLDVVLAAIPLAGNALSKVASAGVKELLIDLGRDVVIEIAVEEFANDLDLTIEAINSGNWGDVPMPGVFTMPSEISLISGIEAFGFDGINVPIPGLDGDVLTVGETLDAGQELLQSIRSIDIQEALVGTPIGFPTFSTSLLAPLR